MNMYAAEHVPAEEFETSFALGDAEGGQAWHDRFTIAKKLHAVALASTLIMAVLAAGILGTMAYFGDRGESLRVQSVAVNYSGEAAVDLLVARNALSNFAIDGDQSGLEVSRLSSARAVAVYQAIFEEDLSRLDASTVASLTEFRDSGESMAAQISANDIDQQSAQRIIEQLDSLTDQLVIFNDEFGDKAIDDALPVFAGIQNSILLMIIMFVVLTVLSIFGSKKIVRNVSGMIGDMTDAMDDIANGAPDTTIPGLQRSDEMGAMARSLAVFRENSLELREVNAKRAADAENELSKQRSAEAEKDRLIGQLAEGFESSIGEVIAAVGAASSQLKSTSQSMASMAEQSASQSGVASKDMERVASTITAAAAATDEFALSIGEVSKQASASAELARDASDVADAANERMGELSKAASEIGEIVELIQTIAQRTNLLALNASIEAARGGEAGRGFAVVASEVKELAKQTSDATAGVVERIEAIQSSTGLSVADINSVVGKIAELEQAAVVIATAVDQQSISGEDLARNIDSVAGGSSDVAHSLVELRDASVSTGSAASQVLGSAEALEQQAASLRDKATYFLAEVRGSARSSVA